MDKIIITAITLFSFPALAGMEPQQPPVYNPVTTYGTYGTYGEPPKSDPQPQPYQTQPQPQQSDKFIRPDGSTRW